MLQPANEEDLPFGYCSGMIQTGHQRLNQGDFTLLCCKCPFSGIMERKQVAQIRRQKVGVTA